MRVFLIVCGAIIVLALIVLLQSSGMPLGEVFAGFLRWPLELSLPIAVIALVLLALLGAAVWQSDKIAHQATAIDVLQKRMSGIRDTITSAEGQQNGADSAVRHLVGTDPVATVDDVEQRLSDTEKRTSQQEAQNEAVELTSRIDAIRRRQQALRGQLGLVSERRREIEPVLTEVKERQSLIERSLAELEKDGDGGSLDARLEEAEGILNRGHERLRVLEAMSESLNQLKGRMDQLQGSVTPLASSDAGIKALFTAAADQQKQVDTALLALEKDGSETIDERVERLSKRKKEIEKRIAALTESFGSLEGIRHDIGTQFQRLNTALDGHLKR